MKFPGGLNIQAMMKQAQQMQEKMAREMDEMRVEASAGGGVVTVEMKGNHEIISLKIDPENSMVLGWAALWHMTHVGQGWTNDAEKTLQIAEDLSLKALKFDPENAEAMGYYAHTCSWKKDFPSALHWFDRALRLNPNLPGVRDAREKLGGLGK